jgi:ABC-2 type transport system permease protein
MANLIKEPFTRLGAVRSVANQIGETFTKSYAVDFSAIAIVAV